MSDPLIIAGRELSSRLFLGTAGYPNRQVMLDSIAASGTAMVTASIRRISLAGDEESLVDLIPKHVHFLPNTAGCQTAKDAVLTAELARDALETNWIKLEVIGDRELLYPDIEELLRATETLVAKGFVVLPYCNDDPVACRKLADAGAAAVMPLGSLIGSGRETWGGGGGAARAHFFDHKICIHYASSNRALVSLFAGGWGQRTKNRSLPAPPLLLVTNRKQARTPLPELVEEALAAGCRWL